MCRVQKSSAWAECIDCREDTSRWIHPPQSPGGDINSWTYQHVGITHAAPVSWGLINSETSRRGGKRRPDPCNGGREILTGAAEKPVRNRETG
jgi:hypothetical protein